MFEPGCGSDVVLGAAFSQEEVGILAVGENDAICANYFVFFHLEVEEDLLVLGLERGEGSLVEEVGVVVDR